MLKLAARLVTLVLPLLMLLVAGCGQQASQAEVDLVTGALTRQNMQLPQISFRDSFLIEGSIDVRNADPQYQDLLPAAFSLSLQREINRDGSNRIYNLKIDGEEKLAEFMRRDGGPGAMGGAPITVMAQMLESAELRFLSDAFFVKLSGQWYEVGVNDLIDLMGPGVPARQREEMRCVMEKAMADPMRLMGGGNVDLTAAQFITDLKKRGPEEIDGVAVDRYTFSYDYEKLAEQLPEMMKQNPMLDLFEQCGATEIKEIMGGLDQMMPGQMEAMAEFYQDMFADNQSEVWLDADGNLRRLAFTMEFDYGKLMPMTGPLFGAGDALGELSNLVIKVKFTESFSDINGTFEIARPGGTLPMSELLKAFFGIDLPSTQRA